MTAPWRAVGLFALLTITLKAASGPDQRDSGRRRGDIFGMMSMPRGGRDPHLPHRGPSVALTGIGRLERPRSFSRRLPHPVDVLRTDESAGFQPVVWVGAVIPRGFLLVPASRIPRSPPATGRLHRLTPPTARRPECFCCVDIRVLGGTQAVGAPENRLALTGFRVHMPTRRAALRRERCRNLHYLCPAVARRRLQRRLEAIPALGQDGPVQPRLG